MLTNLCQIIVDFFVKEDIVPEEQREVYQYGVELSVSTLIGLLIVLAAGAFGGRLIESVIFYIVFCLTRAFCGGFHAHSHLLCKLTFTCVIILVLVMNLVLDPIESYAPLTMHSISGHSTKMNRRFSQKPKEAAILG